MKTIAFILGYKDNFTYLRILLNAKTNIMETKKFVCTTCGSEDVRLDAWASFNGKDWELAETFDHAHCVDCDGETSIVLEIEIDEPIGEETEPLLQELKRATDMLSVEMLDGLEYGAEKQLTNNFTLYHYCEDDIVVINYNTVSEWEEILQVMWNADSEEITYEELIELDSEDFLHKFLWND